MQNIKEFARQFLLWTPVAMHLNQAYFRIDRVTGISMQPSLNQPSTSGDQGSSCDDYSGNDVVLSELLSSSYFWYQPGDIVIIRSPEEPKKELVKRLVALQGHTIRRTTVNGKTEKLTIPQGFCWLEGDRPELRSGSGSSSATQEPVPMALIKGRVQAVLWPPGRLGWLPRSTDWKKCHV